MVALTCTARFDSRQVDVYGFIATALLSNQSPTGFRATFGDNDYVDFRGVGYAYAGGEPIQGTTTGFSVFVDNAPQFKLSGASITIADVLQYAQQPPRDTLKDIFSGNDSLDGSNQVDYLEGFTGNDTYVVENTGDQVIEARGAGTDTVRTTVDYELGAGQYIESLVAKNLGSTAAIDLTGNAFANTIKGNAGNNEIDGGGGRDVLWGGRGKDTFEFDLAVTPGNRDTIKDFNVGGAADSIELSKGVFRALDLGRLDASEFKVLAPGSSVDADDHIIYNRATGTLAYDADGSGGVAAKVFAVIDNNAALSFNDFLVVA